MKPELDDLSKLLKKSFEDQPELLESIVESTQGNHFHREYEFEDPSILKDVKDDLDPTTRQMFIIYSRLIKAYGGNTDAQFIIDFFAYGAAMYSVFVDNRDKFIDSLLIRGSQIRFLISDNDELTVDNFLGVYEKVLESWALSDVLEIYYGSFVPTDISSMMKDVQKKVLEGA